MIVPRLESVVARSRLRSVLLAGTLLAVCQLLAVPAWSAGTAAGTVIQNTAVVSFDLGGTTATQSSNTVSLTVVERIDVLVTLQNGQVFVAPSDVNRSILYTVTNSGNGSETIQLTMDSVLAGDDFDPLPAVPPIYFDTDASGDFTAGDVAYVSGSNDPVLAPDESVDILIVNNIPAGVVNGNLGRSELTATSATGTGNPGDTLAGQGDGGLDAVIGSSGGVAASVGEYLVADVAVTIQKAVTVSDPFGGSEVVPGATLTYTITVEVSNAGTATASAVTDPVPTDTTFVAGSITLNGGSLTDPIDTDAGELDTSGAATVVVRLGDLTQADGIQTVEFQVTID